ncbi:MAG: hypothetical protein AAB466_06470 [Verrucomicrobiota bacterium]
MESAKAQATHDQKAAETARQTARAAKVKLKQARKMAKSTKKAARKAEGQAEESLEALEQAQARLKKLEKRVRKKLRKQSKARNRPSSKTPQKKIALQTQRLLRKSRAVAAGAKSAKRVSPVSKPPARKVTRARPVAGKNVRATSPPAAGVAPGSSSARSSARGGEISTQTGVPVPASEASSDSVPF